MQNKSKKIFLYKQQTILDLQQTKISYYLSTFEHFKNRISFVALICQNLCKFAKV